MYVVYENTNNEPDFYNAVFADSLGEARKMAQEIAMAFESPLAGEPFRINVSIAKVTPILTYYETEKNEGFIYQKVN